MSELSFSEQVRAKIPEGLTGIFAIGGTRTTYILEHNRASREDPGRIDDFADHGDFLMHRYWALIKEYLDLGGQNMIIAAFSYRGFYNRGEEYSELASREMLRLGEDFRSFYEENEIDPYFVGIDTLALLPAGSPGRIVGEKLGEFQRTWNYKPGRRKLLWEIASIPLFTMWNFTSQMGAAERAELDKEVAAAPNLEEVARVLYRRFSVAMFGVSIPMPHFYIGTNKGGDLKLRVPMATALTGGEYLRLFYTPYPSLFMSHEVLQRVVADVAFNERFHSAKTDYSGQYSSELMDAEYQRVVTLSKDAESTVGLVRKVQVEQR